MFPKAYLHGNFLSSIWKYSIFMMTMSSSAWQIADCPPWISEPEPTYGTYYSCPCGALALSHAQSSRINTRSAISDQQSSALFLQYYTVLPPATEYTYYVLKIENGFIAGNNVYICRSQS